MREGVPFGDPHHGQIFGQSNQVSDPPLNLERLFQFLLGRREDPPPWLELEPEPELEP